MVNLRLIKIGEVLANGVGGTLVPISVGFGTRLLRCKNLDKATTKPIKLVGLTYVAVKADGQELSQQIDAVDPAIDAIRKRHVD